MPRAREYKTTPRSTIKSSFEAWLASDRNISAAARLIGVSHATIGRHLADAVSLGLLKSSDAPKTARAQVENLANRANAGGYRSRHTDTADMMRRKPMERDDLPDGEAPVDELIARRKQEFRRHSEAQDARHLQSIKIKIDGPIAIAHLGDPHVDDPGTDIEALERHLTVINKTEGMFGANVGDLQNNWVGRLARLYGEQSTSAKEAWRLTEWLVGACDWLYLLAGNHDCWSGAGDPVQWIARQNGVPYEAWGARLNLEFPNGRAVRINARHDFAGHSMWNTAHGPAKAIQMGWRDHILTCGHKHTSGYQILKDPATGLISHALRVAGYKIHDRYARELGLPNQNISPASVTIIDPSRADDDARLITTIHDVDMAADFLTFLRRKR